MAIPDILRPLAGKFYYICMSMILLGGLMCFVPVFVLQSSWPIIPNYDDGDVLSLFIPAMEINAVHHIAIITFSLTIPSTIDAAFDVAEKFFGGISTASHVSHQVVGINTVEKVLFLLGIQVSSLLFVCLQRISDDIAVSDTEFNKRYVYAAILIASICCSFVLSGGALLLCLHRLFYAFNSQRASSLGTIWNIMAIIIGSVLFSAASILRVGHIVNSQMGFAAVSFYTLAMATFIRSTLVWITGFFSTQKKKKEEKIKSADQVFVPLILIFTFILCSAAVFAPTFQTLIVPDTSLATTRSLKAFYALSIITALMLIVLEKRLKNIEINRGLEALESKRSFVRYISHEVRTPLNTVSLGLELLTEELVTDMSEQGRNYLESVHHIRNASSIAVEILNDLLQYDKLQDNTLHLQKKSIPALEIINDVVSTFRLQARKAGVQLLQSYIQPAGSSSLQDGQQAVSCVEDYLLLQQSFIEVDRPKIAQVLRNLLSNALKFTPSGGKVTVSARLVTRLSLPKHPNGKKGDGADDVPVVNESYFVRSLKTAFWAVLRTFGVRFETEGSMSGRGFSSAVSLHDRNTDKKNHSQHQNQPFTPPTGNMSLGRILNPFSAPSSRRASGRQVAPGDDIVKRPMPKYIIIEVTDTGAGIEKENICRVFNEIVQFNPNELQGGGGSGLGLVLSRGIVSAHRGKIWLTSEGIGKGCTFSVGLPVTIINSTSTRMRNNALDPLHGLMESPVAQQIGKVIAAGAEIMHTRGSFIANLSSYLMPPSLKSNGSAGSRASIGKKSQGSSKNQSRRPSHVLPGQGTPQYALNSSQNNSTSNSIRRAAGVRHATIHDRVSSKRVSPAAIILAGTTPIAGGSQLHSGAMSLRSSMSSTTNKKHGQHGGGGGGDEQDGGGQAQGVSPHGSRHGSSESRHQSNSSNASSKRDGELMLSRRASSASNLAREEQLFMQRLANYQEEKDMHIDEDCKDAESMYCDAAGGTCSVGMSLANTPSMLSPLQYSPQVCMDPRGNADSIPSGTMAKKFMYHVLVVDDSALNRRMLCKALAAIGCTTEEAEDGAIAVAMVKRSLPDRSSAGSSRRGSVSSLGVSGLSALLKGAGMRNASLKEELSYRSSSNVSGDCRSVADSQAAVAALANNLARGSFSAPPAPIMNCASGEPMMSPADGASSLIARATMQSIAASMVLAANAAGKVDGVSGEQNPVAAAAVAAAGDFGITPGHGDVSPKGKPPRKPHQGAQTPTERQFDFILCDNIMPRMDGPTATQKIRALGYTNPIFGVTGNVLPSDVDEFIEKGANDVLAKPLKLALLKEAIRNHVAPPSARSNHYHGSNSNSNSNSSSHHHSRRQSASSSPRS